LLSRQFQHSLSAAEATVVAGVEVPMAAAVAAAFTVAVVGAFMAVAALAVGADIMAAGGLLVEEVITKAAFVVGQGLVLTVRAVVRTAGLKRAAVLAQAEVVRRMFVRQSTMGSGTRSATPAVPGV